MPASSATTFFIVENNIAIAQVVAGRTEMVR